MEPYRNLEADSSGSSLPCTVTTDLDAFLSGVYRYYCEKGLRAVIFRSFSNLVASVFTFVLSVAVLLLIDWPGVVNCTTEGQCLAFFYENPFEPLTLYRLVVLCQLVPLGLYTVVLASLSSVAKIREAIRVSEFFKSALSIPDDDMLHFLSWEEIVKRLCAFQARADVPLCIVQDQLSPMEVHSIILRTESVTLEIFKRWFSIFVEPNGGTVLGQLPLQSTALKWCFQHTVVSWLFSDRYRIRADLTPETFVTSIKSRIRLVGVLSALLIGPVFIFSTLLLFIRETDNVRTQRTSLFEKQFSGLASIALAHFGELPHHVETRLGCSTVSAEEFSRRIIPDKSLEASFNMMKFVASGIVAVLAVTAVVQDTAVLYMTIMGKNLLFYLALFSGLVALASGLAGTHSSLTVEKKELAAKKLLSGTHYLSCPQMIDDSSSMPPLLKARKLDAISSTFCELFFKPKLVNLVYQIAGILLLPFYFLTVFPETLADIVAETKFHHSENLGDFAAASFLVPGTSSTEQTEMTASPGTLSKERAMSLLFYFEKYGCFSGLSKDQVSLGEEIYLKFAKSAAEQQFSPFFFYLVTHVSPYTNLFDLPPHIAGS